MELEKKIKEDMHRLGCHSKLKIALCYQLYMYLVDEKCMYDTEYCYNMDVDTLYVVAKPGKNEKLNIYVPILTSDSITMEFVNDLQENLCTVETGPTINLAFMEGDTTTVIYTFSKGLLGLQAPDGLMQRKKREERHSFINSEIIKNRKDIIESAMNGGPVSED